MNARDAYRRCEAILRARPHEFPVGSVFAPARVRRPLVAIHAFARVADDAVDEPRYAGRRDAELDRLDDQLRACAFGEPVTDPVFVALRDAIDRHDLPVVELERVLAGARLDLATDAYATFGELRDYLRLAAEPIGRLYLHLGGCRAPAALRYVEDLASGLLIVKQLQNAAADRARGRSYLPREDLQHFAVTDAELRAGRADRAVDQLVRYQVARARALFERAHPVLDEVGPALRTELALTWLTGVAMLRRVEAAGARALHQRVSLSWADRAARFARALAGGYQPQRHALEAMRT